MTIPVFAAAVDVHHQEDISQEQEKVTQETTAYYCQHQEIGIEFLCDPDWIMEEHENGATFILISSEPEVSLTLIKEDSAVITLKDLTTEVLQEMGQYQEGFVVEEVRIAGHNALNVEALSLADDDIRLSDFYVTRDGVLYSLLFSVRSKEHFNEFVPVIFNIVNSVQFLDEVKP